MSGFDLGALLLKLRPKAAPAPAAPFEDKGYYSFNLRTLSHAQLDALTAILDCLISHGADDGVDVDELCEHLAGLDDAAARVVQSHFAVPPGREPAPPVVIDRELEAALGFDRPPPRPRPRPPPVIEPEPPAKRGGGVRRYRGRQAGAPPTDTLKPSPAPPLSGRKREQKPEPISLLVGKVVGIRSSPHWIGGET